MGVTGGGSNLLGTPGEVLLGTPGEVRGGKVGGTNPGGGGNLVKTVFFACFAAV